MSKVHLPVVPTQGVYRQLLQAMSRPGKLYDLPVGEFPSLLLGVCLTLLDHEVSFCVVPTRAEAAAWQDEIFAATKARRAPLEEADFIIVPGGSSGEAVARAKTGTPPFPDEGATIVYVATDPLSGSMVNNPAPLLSGPGLKEETTPDINPLAEAEWKLLRDINAEYPLGVDVICLIGNRQAMCIPRSTRIRIG